MSKLLKQQLKRTSLMQILPECSDEARLPSMAQIISRLIANGISAERKSIYDDMESLRLFKPDVTTTKARPDSYTSGVAISSPSSKISIRRL